MRVICNTSPLVGLMKIGRLNLLPQLFDEVIIPQAVLDELCADPKRHSSESEQILAMVNRQELHVYTVKNEAAVKLMYGKLHYGELEVIVGAKELGLTVAVIDERAARKTAQAFLIQTLGILGILLLAKERGLVQEIKPDLDHLRASGYRIADPLYEKILRDANE